MNAKMRRELPQHLVQVMNRLLALDPDAVRELVDHRVECNEAMATDQTIPVQHVQGVDRVGLLGVLNAVLGDAGVDSKLVVSEDSTGRVTFRTMVVPDVVRHPDP